MASVAAVAVRPPFGECRLQNYRSRYGLDVHCLAKKQQKNPCVCRRHTSWFIRKTWAMSCPAIVPDGPCKLAILDLSKSTVVETKSWCETFASQKTRVLWNLEVSIEYFLAHLMVRISRGKGNRKSVTLCVPVGSRNLEAAESVTHN